MASFVERMQDYALKAAREGKEETSWTDPNEAYEAALREFVAGLLDPTISAGFLASFEALRRADRAARARSIRLSQLALKSDCCRACPIFIRAPSSGICRWSIRTIGARSTTRPDAASFGLNVRPGPSFARTGKAELSNSP